MILNTLDKKPLDRMFARRHLEGYVNYVSSVTLKR